MGQSAVLVSQRGKYLSYPGTLGYELKVIQQPRILHRSSHWLSSRFGLSHA
jgi:hypothetical protein